MGLMGQLLDIDDPLWVTLNHNFRTYGDPLEGFTRVWIEVHQTYFLAEREEYPDLIKAMLGFIEAIDRPGKIHAELDYHNHVEQARRKISVHRVVFHFEDEASAFAFKMRFG
jgi:hypothetical protein